MEKQELYKTPNKYLARMQVVHFGKILFNLQFLALAVMFASVISFILPAIYYIFLLAISLLTLFSIYSWYPEFASYWSSGEVLGKVATVMMESWKYTIPIVLGLSIISIVCLCFDKRQKHPARIAISAVIAVVATIILIAKLINGGVVS